MAEEDLDSASQFSSAPQAFVAIDQCQGLRLDAKKDNESEVTIIEQLKASNAGNFNRKNEEEDGNYIIHLGVGEASKQIFEDFVKMKQTQNFNTNPDFLKWLLEVGETSVLESSSSTDKDVKNDGRKKIDKTNITEDFVVTEVCKKKIDDTNIMEDLIVTEDEEYGAFIISPEQQMGKEEGANLNSPALGNSCDQVNTANKTSDEILYDRFIKHLTKRKETVQKEKDMENKSNKTNKRMINVNVKVLIEDTEFPRVVEQAKCIQHNSNFEFDLSSVKKLRQFPSKFTKFDRERHEELEKLERTVNKNNAVTDESPTKQNNGKGVKRKTLPSVITIPIKIQAPVTDVQAKLIESKQLISIAKLNEKIPVALETEGDKEVKKV